MDGRARHPGEGASAAARTGGQKSSWKSTTISAGRNDMMTLLV